ncbi:MAG: YbbR-like domain-containing protein [Anaerolineales bacterium]
MFRPFRWLGKNIGNLALALLLAVVIWYSAIVATDPSEDREYPLPVDIEFVGQDPSLIMVNKVPLQAQMVIRAPRSIWSQLEDNPDYVRAWVDLTGLVPGVYTLTVKTQVQLMPNQVTEVTPTELMVALEPLLVEEYPVELVTIGEPTLGYSKGSSRLEPTDVIVSGPSSIMDRVSTVRAEFDISGLSETVTKDLALKAIDDDGDTISGVVINPEVVSLTQNIVLLGGYRNVVVKVMTTGQVAEGYWLTNIAVSPPNVTVFSANPQLVEQLPGFVETQPVDLDSLNDDVDYRLTLNLPEGIELAGEESVLVRLSIAALEGSLPITLPIEVVGLPPDCEALSSPNQVDLLLKGPLPVLNNLKPGGIRVSVDLSGYEPGTYQVTPVVDLLPYGVQVASMLPESVEITIVLLDSTETTEAIPTSQATNTPTP